MTRAKSFLSGLEEVLGVGVLLMALVAAATTVLPPPGPSSSAAAGYVVTGLLLASAALFFAASRHLVRTGSINAVLHLSPLVAFAGIPVTGMLLSQA